MPFDTATVGGTFHAMHIGHKRYLEIAFGVAHWVYIHITADEFANALKPYTVKPFDVRRKQIEDVLEECGWRHRAEIRTLESNGDLRCFCLNTDLSIAVVEPAYLEQFRHLNAERRSKGLEEYCILLKPRTRIAGDLDLSSRALNTADFGG
jgi:cytidyltransferase-like protein